MRQMKYVILLTVFFAGVLAASERAEARVIKKSFYMLKGTTRRISIDSTRVKKLKVKKKRLRVRVKDFSIRVYGKKVGRTTFSYRIPGMKDRYRYTVTVCSRKKVRKTANKRLKKFLNRLPAGTPYAFVDFNRDGVKELIHKGKITYYHYRKKKCITQRYGFRDVYVSPKTKMLFVTYRKPKENKDFFFISEFYRPSAYKVFRLKGTGTGYKKYTPAGAKVFGVMAPYAYYDNSYDQDDYDYESMAEADIEENIRKKMPFYHAVVWKIKK